MDLDRCFFSFFVLFDLERDLDFLESLSSSSRLDDSDDELELESDELLCCNKCNVNALNKFTKFS